MTEDLTAYVYRMGEVVVPYVLNPAPMRFAGIALIIAAFGMRHGLHAERPRMLDLISLLLLIVSYVGFVQR